MTHPLIIPMMRDVPEAWVLPGITRVISLHYIRSSVRTLAIMVVMRTGSYASPGSGILLSMVLPL
jgi:hypothetical protein